MKRGTQKSKLGVMSGIRYHIRPETRPLSLPLRLPSPSPAWHRRIRPPHAAKPPPNHSSLHSLQNAVLNSHRHPLTREIAVEDARLFSGESLRFQPRADEWMFVLRRPALFVLQRSFTTPTTLAIFFCGDVEPRLSLGKEVILNSCYGREEVLG